MGTYAFLSLGALEVAWSKNENLYGHDELFQEGDLKSRPIDDDESDRPEEWYEKPLRNLKDRLDLLGYTLAHAEYEFNNPSEFSDDEPLPFKFEEVMNVLKSVNARKVTNDFSEKLEPGIFAPKEMQDVIVNVRTIHPYSERNWDLSALLEKFSPYSQLRVLAESPHNLDLPVKWDFDGVVRNGWVKRSEISHGTKAQFLIVTEGSSDTKILRQAIDILRPHIADLFYFVDMEEGYPFTGTGNVFNFVKGLVGISVKNNVVVIFDNDVEGIATMNRCRSLNLPDNMRVMKLPDRPEFERFNTVGPNGESLADINGKAASIECYLDLDDKAQVRWTNYREDTKSYHGSLIAKDRLKKRFLCQQELDSLYNYSKLENVLDLIIAECVSIRSKIL